MCCICVFKKINRTFWNNLNNFRVLKLGWNNRHFPCDKCSEDGQFNHWAWKKATCGELWVRWNKRGGVNQSSPLTVQPYRGSGVYQCLHAEMKSRTYTILLRMFHHAKRWAIGIKIMATNVLLWPPPHPKLVLRVRCNTIFMLLTKINL